MFALLVVVGPQLGGGKGGGWSRVKSSRVAGKTPAEVNVLFFLDVFDSVFNVKHSVLIR